MNGWYAPLDPDCPDVEAFEAAGDDPISQSCGCWDDFTEAFEAKHRATCVRCQAYGAANVGVA